MPSCWKNPTDVANTPDKRASWIFLDEQEAVGCHGIYDDVLVMTNACEKWNDVILCLY